MARLLNESQIDFATDSDMAKAISTLIGAASNDALDEAFSLLSYDDVANVSAIASRIEDDLNA